MASPTSSLAPGISPSVPVLLIHATSSAFFHPPPPPPQPPLLSEMKRHSSYSGGLSSRGFSGLKEETLRSHAYPYLKE